MPLRSLRIQDLRNIRHGELVFSPEVNCFCGPNGSGKSSVLEAVHLLSTARSFRTSKVRSVVNYEADRVIVFGEVSHGERGTLPIGMERTAGTTTVRVAGQNLASIGELLGLLPVQYLGPESFRILELGPAYRRRTLDWGVFHVEHSFFKIWHRYDKLLQQRNVVLRTRRDTDTLNAWDLELAEAGERITRMRQQYLADIHPYLQRCLDVFFDEGSALELQFDRGWRSPEELITALAHHRDADIKAGHTQVGPHRADLDFKVAGRVAREVLSRGQQKLLIAAFRLAQLQHLNAVHPENPGVVLADDLFAELDANNARLVLMQLLGCNAQIVLTHLASTLPAEVGDTLKDRDVAMFHVEQGTIRRT